MASLAPQPRPGTIAPLAAEANFLLKDGQLLVQLTDARGEAVARITPDARGLEALGRAALSMAAAADQLAAAPHLDAGRSIPLFTRASLRPALREAGE